jgi:transcriptional regulator with XRE-family HTH domain
VNAHQPSRFLVSADEPVLDLNHLDPQDEDANCERVAQNLQRLRSKRLLSLDALARLCGVSRAMLAQIESGRSVPSIKVLCKIAKGLKVSVAAFLEHRAFEGVAVLSASQSKRLVSASGTFVSRALFPYDVARQSEFYELRLSPLGEDQSEGHGLLVSRKTWWWLRGCWKSASTMSAICFPPGIRFCFMPTSPIAIATPPTVKRSRTWW